MVTALVLELVLFILGLMALMRMMRAYRGRNSVLMLDWFLRGSGSLWGIVMMKRDLALGGLEGEPGTEVGCKECIE